MENSDAYHMFNENEFGDKFHCSLGISVSYICNHSITLEMLKRFVCRIYSCRVRDIES